MPGMQIYVNIVASISWTIGFLEKLYFFIAHIESKRLTQTKSCLSGVCSWDIFWHIGAKHFKESWEDIKTNIPISKLQ